MRLAMLGLAGVLGIAFAQDGFAQAGDPVQENEAPGTEIEIDIGKDGVEVGREKNLNPSPIEIDGTTTGLEPLNDADTPAAPDPVDAELPGEGPEDLSGPDDDDSLPE
jgi:hypothetical protein